MRCRIVTIVMTWWVVLAGVLDIAPHTIAAAVRVLDGPPVIGDAGAGPVVYWQDRTANNRLVHFLRVDLANPNYEVTTIMDPHPGLMPAEYLVDPTKGTDVTTVLRNPLALANENNVVAAINTNAFRYGWNTVDFGKSSWVAGKPIMTFGLVVQDGVQRSQKQDARIPLWIDNNNRAHVGHPGPDDQVKQAVANWEAGTDGWPLQNGQVAATSTTRYLRTLAGTDQTGRWLYLLATGSTEAGGTQITLPEAAALMLARGSYNAINFDGGGSSTMLLDNGVNGALRAVEDPSYLRPLPVMLAVRAVPEPSALAGFGLAVFGLTARRRNGLKNGGGMSSVQVSQLAQFTSFK